MHLLQRLVDTSDFPARWYCGSWSDAHGWTHIVADLLIFAAYMAIPLMLARLYRQRRADVPFPHLLLLFCAFVSVCGTTHLIEASIFWQPVYRLSALFKVLTAIVSWATVIAFVPALPRMLSMTFPEELERQVNERTQMLRARTRDLEARQAELEAARAELATTNAQLSNEHAAMEEFIYSVSHDLKAPLVTTTGFLDVLREGVEDEDPESIELALSRIDNATARMGALLEDLLDVGRIQRVSPEPEEVPLEAAVQGCLDGLSELLEQSGVEATVSVSGSVHMDPSWLARALDNLVTNAVKYGDRTVRITGGIPDPEDPSLVQVRVEDDGPGIASEHRERVFQLFHRLHRDKEGTGVGLSIVDRIARQHGGRVWVEEASLGGAAFVLALPTLPPESASHG